MEDAFGADIDFAQLVKIYGNAPEGAEIRYSPAQCMGAREDCIKSLILGGGGDIFSS